MAKSSDSPLRKEIELADGMVYSCKDYVNLAADKLLKKCDAILDIEQASELLIRTVLYGKNNENSEILKFGVSTVEEVIIDPVNRIMYMTRPKTMKQSLMYKHGNRILKHCQSQTKTTAEYFLDKINLEEHLSKLQAKSDDKMYIACPSTFMMYKESTGHNNPKNEEFMDWAFGASIADDDLLMEKANVSTLELKSLDHIVFGKGEKKHPFLRTVSVRLDEQFQNPRTYKLSIVVQGTNNSPHSIAGIIYR